MKANRLTVLALVLVLALLLAGCGAPAAGSSSAAQPEEPAAAAEGEAPAGASGAKQAGDYTLEDLKGMTLAFSPKTLNNPFYVALEEGVQEAAAQYGISIEASAPPSETDIEQQIGMIESFIQKGIDGILISPTGSIELVNVCKQAIDADIPVFAVDTRLDEETEETYRGYACTDNYAGGVLAGQWIAEQLGGEGKVAVMDGYAGNSATTQRFQGFHEGIEGTNIEVVATALGYCERSKGMEAAENFISANPELDAIFCCNDMMVLGTAEAVKAAGKTDDIIICGFDGQPETSQAILDGEVNATIAQHPKTMGRIGVEMFVSYMTGQDYQLENDTGCKVVTAENADQYLQYN